MTDTTDQNVRGTIMISDESFLTQARINLAITDAKADIASEVASDERCQRYFACFLLAQRFKMQYVTRSGDRTYSDIDPNVYLKMYTDRMAKLRGRGTEKINYDSDMVDDGVEY